MVNSSISSDHQGPIPRHVRVGTLLNSVNPASVINAIGMKRRSVLIRSNNCSNCYLLDALHKASKVSFDRFWTIAWSMANRCTCRDYESVQRSGSVNWNVAHPMGFVMRGVGYVFK